MEIDGRHAAPPQRPEPPSHTQQPGRGTNPAQSSESVGNPAFIIDLGPNAVSGAPDGEGTGDAYTGPGKSTESPAHRARAYLSQFLAQNETQESPIKSFGHIVSQLAQGRPIGEIFSAFTVPQQDGEEGDGETESGATETIVEGNGEQETPVVAGNPVPTLLETFLENEEEDGGIAAT